MHRNITSSEVPCSLYHVQSWFVYGFQLCYEWDIKFTWVSGYSQRNDNEASPNFHIAFTQFLLCNSLAQFHFFFFDFIFSFWRSHLARVFVLNFCSFFFNIFRGFLLAIRFRRSIRFVCKTPCFIPFPGSNLWCTFYMHIRFSYKNEHKCIRNSNCIIFSESTEVALRPQSPITAKAATNDLEQ